MSSDSGIANCSIVSLIKCTVPILNPKLNTINAYCNEKFDRVVSLSLFEHVAHKNFNNHWNILKKHYGENFFRVWNYYLLTCAGAFRARANQLWQVVLSKSGVYGGYVAVR